jgi:hypothetical protein
MYVEGKCPLGFIRIWACGSEAKGKSNFGMVKVREIPKFEEFFSLQIDFLNFSGLFTIELDYFQGPIHTCANDTCHTS